MSLLHDKAKSPANDVMYIRGVPYTLRDAGVCSQPAGKLKRVSISAKTTAPASQDNQLAHVATAVGVRAGICRFESEARTGIMKSRRMVRFFSSQAVPMRLLRQLVQDVYGAGPDEEARLARFAMVESPTSMARVTGLTAAWLRREGVLLDGPGVDAPTAIFGDAPHMAVLYGPNDAPGAAAACSLALARLEWAAAGAGLGSCFAGELVQAAACDSEVASALAVPEGHLVFAALLLGYPHLPADRRASGHRSRIVWL